MKLLKLIIALWLIAISIATLPALLSLSKIDEIAKNPEILRNFMKDERIQIIYETEGGSKAFSFIVKDGVVVESREGKIDNPTIIIHCNSSEAEKIINSKNQILALMDALSNGGILEVKKSSPMFSIIVKGLELMKLIKSI